VVAIAAAEEAPETGAVAAPASPGPARQRAARPRAAAKKPAAKAAKPAAKAAPKSAAARGSKPKK
jgi:hypothetical protein